VVVIHRGMDEPMTLQRVAMAADAAAGAIGLAVVLATGPAQEPMATPSWDVAQLLDVKVDQVAGMGVLVTADRLAGGPVQLGQAAEAPADQHGMHGRGGQPDQGSDLGRPQPLSPAQVHDPAHHRGRGAAG
jgi:hypothetical protein